MKSLDESFLLVEVLWRRLSVNQAGSELVHDVGAMLLTVTNKVRHAFWGVSHFRILSLLMLRLKLNLGHITLEILQLLLAPLDSDILRNHTLTCISCSKALMLSYRAL